MDRYCATQNRIFAGLIAFLLAICRSSATEPGDPLAGFDEYAEAALIDLRTPGLAVAVIKGGKVVFARGYGVCRAGETCAVTRHCRSVANTSRSNSNELATPYRRTPFAVGVSNPVGCSPNPGYLVWLKHSFTRSFEANTMKKKPEGFMSMPLWQKGLFLIGCGVAA